MKKVFIVLVAGLLGISICKAQQQTQTIAKIEPVNQSRVQEIATMLSETPQGFGDPIQQREQWDKLLKSGQFKALIEEADRIIKQPFPKLTEELYMTYYKGKDSETSKHFIMNRRRLLTKAVWAECLTNKGKYLPYINAALDDLVHTTSWSFPAEDRNKTNYEGKLFTINLSSSAYGYDIAQTLYLLNERLNETQKKEILAALYQKVFEPTLAAIKNNNANDEFTPLANTGNHNAATLAGVTGAALAAIPSKEERAVFVSIAERYAGNYMVGITDDGYCTEGMGYYFYGFGHYLLIREHLWQSTKGKIDLFERPKISIYGEFVPGMEIVNGVFPAISDCEQIIKPNTLIMYYLNKNLDLGMPEYDTVRYSEAEQIALANLMYFFPGSATIAKTKKSNRSGELRHYFEDAGVLTARPAAVNANSMGATFKGGHNNEHHNHNDIGSFTIVVGNELIMGDAGLATYTPKYFGKQRYDLYKTTASYGHDVPLVAGKQQRTGSVAKAVITKTSFTEKKDVFEMDLRSGYDLPELQKLIRTFTYNRQNEESIEVLDEFSFSSPNTFETALISRYTWKKISDTEIVIIGKQYSLKIKVVASGPIEWSEEIIDEGPKPYTRIAVRLKDKTSNGYLKMQFTKGK